MRLVVHDGDAWRQLVSQLLGERGQCVGVPGCVVAVDEHRILGQLVGQGVVALELRQFIRRAEVHLDVTREVRERTQNLYAHGGDAMRKGNRVRLKAERRAQDNS
eukprot:scaffold25490_cov30-Tisochrysis_lutea.AAC.1